MAPDGGGPPDPHVDPARWDGLITAVGPESILVVISSWMGTELKRQCAPEDVWQETLAYAWRDREQHEWAGERKYRGWLLAIARNRVRAMGRGTAVAKRGAGQRAALFSDLGVGEDVALSALLPAGSTTPSRVASSREQARLMEEALATLSDDLRAVVHRRLFEERTMEDIATELEIGLSAAWYRFHEGAKRYARALAVLRTRTRERPEG